MLGPAEDIEKLRLQLVDLAVAVESCPPEALAELSSVMQRQQNSVEELRRRAATGVAKSGVYALDGFRSQGRWISLHSGLPHSAANRLARVSKTMSLLRYASDAGLDGVLNDTHVAQLVHCYSASPDRFDEQAEAAFTELAATGDLAKRCRSTRREPKRSSISLTRICAAGPANGPARPALPVPRGRRTTQPLRHPPLHPMGTRREYRHQQRATAVPLASRVPGQPTLDRRTRRTTTARIPQTRRQPTPTLSTRPHTTPTPRTTLNGRSG